MQNKKVIKKKQVVNFRMDEIVSKVISDPTQNKPLKLIKGFIGASSEKNHIRVYFDQSFNRFIEVPIDKIVHSEEISKEQSVLGGSYIWVEGNASYIYGHPSSANRPRAKFLQGDIYKQYQRSKAPKYRSFDDPVEGSTHDGCSGTDSNGDCGPTYDAICTTGGLPTNNCPPTSDMACGISSPNTCPTESSCPTNDPNLCPTSSHCLTSDTGCITQTSLCITSNYGCGNTSDSTCQPQTNVACNTMDLSCDYTMAASCAYTNNTCATSNPCVTIRCLPTQVVHCMPTSYHCHVTQANCPTQTHNFVCNTMSVHCVPTPTDTCALPKRYNKYFNPYQYYK